MANVLVYRDPDHPAEVEFDVVPRAGDQVLWPPKGSSPKFHDVTLGWHVPTAGGSFRYSTRLVPAQGAGHIS